MNPDARRTAPGTGGIMEEPHLFAAEVVVVVLAVRDDRLVIAAQAAGPGPPALPRRWLGPEGAASAAAAALLPVPPAASAPLPVDIRAPDGDGGGHPVLTAAQVLLAPAGTDPVECDLRPLADLAADDRRYLQAATSAARLLLTDPDVAVQMLPPEFTLRELRRVHELVLGVDLDPANFNKRAMSGDFLEPVGRAPSGGRPATTYRRGPGQPPDGLVAQRKVVRAS